MTYIHFHLHNVRCTLVAENINIRKKKMNIAEPMKYATTSHVTGLPRRVKRTQCSFRCPTPRQCSRNVSYSSCQNIVLAHEVEKLRLRLPCRIWWHPDGAEVLTFPAAPPPARWGPAPGGTPPHLASGAFLQDCPTYSWDPTRSRVSRPVLLVLFLWYWGSQQHTASLPFPGVGEGASTFWLLANAQLIQWLYCHFPQPLGCGQTLWSFTEVSGE